MVDTVDIAKTAFDKFVQKIKSSSNILETNKDLILSYGNERIAAGLKAGSVLTALQILYRLALESKAPFPGVSKDQLIAFFNNLKTDAAPLVTGNGTIYKSPSHDYSQATLMLMKTNVKTFWKWLAQNHSILRNESGVPLATAWIKVSEHKQKFRFKKEVLTREEILQMIKSTPKSRNKAIIAVLFESGMRVGELLNMRRSEITFHDDYCEFFCDGKTGKRPVVLIQSGPYLRQWLNALDAKAEKIEEKYRDYIWLTEPEFGQSSNLPITTTESVLLMLRYVAKKAGIKKRVWTHGFRHSSATDFARQGYNETELRLKFGWTPTSTVPANYTHYRHDELKNKLLVRAGKKTGIEEPDGIVIPSKACPFCSYENPSENEYCGKCAKPLSVAKIKEMEKSMKAFAFTQEIINNLTMLEKKGFDIRQFNQFMADWVKNDTTKGEKNE